jgi:hypothetical protein
MEILVKYSDQDLEQALREMRLFAAFCGYVVEKIEAIPTLDESEWLIIFHGIYPSRLRTGDGRWVEDVWREDSADVISFLEGKATTCPRNWKFYQGNGFCYAEYDPGVRSPGIVIPLIGIADNGNDKKIFTNRRII